MVERIFTSPEAKFASFCFETLLFSTSNSLNETGMIIVCNRERLSSNSEILTVALVVEE
jgi:hypothetical protein